MRLPPLRGWGRLAVSNARPFADHQLYPSTPVPCPGRGWPPPTVPVILTPGRRHDHGKTPRVHACRRRRRAREDPAQPDRQADRNLESGALGWATVAMTAGQIGNGSEDAD